MVLPSKISKTASSTFCAVCFLFFTVGQVDAQSIFRDHRDVKPIIPNIVPPEGPEMPGEAGELPGMEPGMTPEGENLENPDNPGVSEDPENPANPENPENAENGEGESLVAMPVITEEMKAEQALNRKREEAANKSTPGVAALFEKAGRLDSLAIVPGSEVEDIVEAAPGVTEELGEDSSSGNGKSTGSKLKSTFMTQANARTFTFSIPAPRGQILDRNGKPLAQSKVVNYAAIQFPRWGDDADDTAVLKFAADRIAHVNRIIGTEWDLAPKTVRSHYENRRWMPLLFSSALTKDESEKLGKARVDGLVLQPVYLRHYPNEELLSHVIGYVGKRPPRATGPIGSDEPIWGAAIGAQGLELAYDEQLTGTPGKISELYDGEGNLIREDTIAVPRPGNNIITTIDIDMQRLVENLLQRRTHRGAMVVMDCNTGDIMAMGSYPQFNPNDFIPSISTDKYKELLEDKEKPLYPRAFQGTYPPASTFKVCTALSFLDVGYINSRETYPCPSAWTIGNLTMKNWNSQPESDMNVVSAIARSCNTWFYEIAIHAGADTMSSMATRLGLGEKTGLPLAENAGFIPNNRYWVTNYGYRLSDGDEANMSIGQGRVKTTPVQIARMMAAIGNTEYVFKSRLVKQVQDVNHNVVEVFPPEIRNKLAVNKYALAAVRKGMDNVVNASFGTGKAGAHPVTVAAKTGTGQWITQENRNIAWFAGYFPKQNPVYSFAIVYEGNPGETVSGGKKAAPIISEFLNTYLTTSRMNDVLRRSRELRGDYNPEIMTDTSSYLNGLNATVVSEAGQPESIFRSASGATSAEPNPVEAEPIPEEPAPTPGATERRGNFFNRLFGGRRRR